MIWKSQIWVQPSKVFLAFSKLLDLEFLVLRYLIVGLYLFLPVLWN